MRSRGNDEGPSLQPRSQALFAVKQGLDRSPSKGWLSHDQIFQYIWRIILQENFETILENLVM